LVDFLKDHIFIFLGKVTEPKVVKGVKRRW